MRHVFKAIVAPGQMAAAMLLIAAVAAPTTIGNAQTAKPAKPVNPLSTVSESAMGGHVLGSPTAPGKLIEYMSYTCPSCAAFESEAHEPLRSKFIANGNYSFEIRNLVRDPVDLTVALIARCGDRQGFFRRHQGFLTDQQVWLGKAMAAGPTVQKSWYEGDFNARLKKISADLGLYEQVRKYAPLLTNAQIDACLTNKAEQDKVIAMTRFASTNEKITGTPGFTINGVLADKVYNWKALEPKLATR